MEALYLPVPRTSNTQIPKFKPCIQHIPLTGRKSSLQCHFAKDDEPLPRRSDLLKNSKKGSKLQVKTTRRLISISTADSGYKGQWTCDFILTLRELQLADLAEEGHGDAEVYIGVDIQKHAGFGYSIDGKIVSSFTTRCSNCFSKYVKEIDTTFNVWVLPSGRGSHSLPEIGGDDPSVIYVKPGTEADLDSLIRDTIRLYSSAKETCSESCWKSAPTPQFIGKKENYFDRRWARLLEFKRSMAS